MDKRCFWGLSIYLFNSKKIDNFWFVPLCKQLIMYRFLGFLGIHYHQFEYRQKAKKDEAYQL